MDRQRHKDFAFSLALGISVAIILAVGHVTYGIHFMDMTKHDLAMLDSYVFFLSWASLLLISTMFYYFKRDPSSTLGVALGGVWALTSGFQDLMVYVFLGYFRDTYPWLVKTPPGIMAYIFNTEVTTFMLVFNSFIFGIILLGTSYYLFQYEDQIFGIEV